MNIDQTSLVAAFSGLKAVFTEALSLAEPGIAEELLATVESTTTTEYYPVAALLGDLEEVLDEVTITSIGRYVASVPNKTYARAVEVKRDDIADDHLGLYKPAVQQLAVRARLYHIRLTAQAILGGFAGAWIDATTVFSATHTWPGGLGWSNLGAPAALGLVTLNAATNALEQRVGPDGAPMGLTATHLVCGPANRGAAEAILFPKQILGTDNIMYQRVKIALMPRFGASTAWFVCDAGVVKPMVLQNREGPEFTAQEDPGSHVAFYQEKYGYKARRRCAVAILAPWLIQANAGV